MKQPLEHRYDNPFFNYTTLLVLFFIIPMSSFCHTNIISSVNLQDKDKLMSMLTYPTVEEAIKRRVEMKARAYGQEVTVDDKGGADPVYKINPGLVANLYGDWIMPLTKEVQVQYLLRRLD